MREIKFRVWDKDYECMHICGENCHDTIYYGEDNRAMYYNLQNGEGSAIYDSDEDSAYVLIPCVDLKDKHGNEVYSDHILSYKPIRYTDCSRTEIAEIGEESLISIVTHRPIATVIKPHSKNVRCFGWDKETGEGLILGLTSEEIEIVGSVYENPELLEGGPPDAD